MSYELDSILQTGARTSLEQYPIIVNASFTGAGFVSINKAHIMRELGLAVINDINSLYTILNIAK